MHVIVAGAGIIGTTTAYALATRGCEVTVMDLAAHPAQGASQANGGFLSAAHCAPWAAPGVPGMALKSLWQPDAPFGFQPDFSLRQLRWLWAMYRQCNAGSFTDHRNRMMRLGVYSRKCLDDWQQHTAIACERRNQGSLLVFQDDAKVQGGQRHTQSLSDLGFDAHWLDKNAVLEIEPGLAHASTAIAGGIMVSDDASGDCEQFTQGLMQWNQSHGVGFVGNANISGFQMRGGQVQGLLVNGELHQADAYVVATGAASQQLVRPLFDLPVYPVKGYSFTAPVRDAERAPQRAVLDDVSKLAIARFAHRVRVAGVAEIAGDNLSLSTRRCQQLIKRFERLYPDAADLGQAQFWCGLRPMTPDGTPVIGATPVPGVYLNTGHGTYGWTMSCGSARLLADLMLGQSSPLRAQDYALSRFH